MQPYYTTELGELFQGDCLELMAALPAKSQDLIFADPPFNLAKNYGRGINDKMRDEDYLAWLVRGLRRAFASSRREAQCGFTTCPDGMCSSGTS